MVIEGSNNDDDWKILDERKNEDCLIGLKLQHTFDIQTNFGINESFRYLQIRSIGADCSGDNYLVFSALEYFGFLF